MNTIYSVNKFSCVCYINHSLQEIINANYLQDLSIFLNYSNFSALNVQINRALVILTNYHIWFTTFDCWVSWIDFYQERAADCAVSTETALL